VKSSSTAKSRRERTPAPGSLPLGKVFKSGNSAALRLPAGLQVPVGKTFTLTPTASGFVASDPADLARRRKALAALFGSAADFPLREP
jgi:antitoxin VapB